MDSQTTKDKGSGCGAVGRAVAFDTRGPGFESSHRQPKMNIYLLFVEKTKNKEKEAGNGPFKKRQGQLERIS